MKVYVFIFKNFVILSAMLCFLSINSYSGFHGRVMDVNGNPVESTIYISDDHRYLYELETNDGNFNLNHGGWYKLLVIPKDSNHIPGYFKKDTISTFFWEEATYLNLIDTNDLLKIIIDTLLPITGPGRLYGEIDAVEYPCIEGKKEKTQFLEDTIIIFIYVLDANFNTRKFLNFQNHIFYAIYDPIEYTFDNLDTGSYNIIIDALGFPNYRYPESIRISNDSINFEHNHHFGRGGSVEENNLFNNYPIFPNPTTENATILFSLKEQSEINIKVYNALGIEVSSLAVNEFFDSGQHNIQLDTEDLTSGMYFCILKAGDKVQTAKFVVTK